MPWAEVAPEGMTVDLSGREPEGSEAEGRQRQFPGLALAPCLFPFGMIYFDLKGVGR